MIAPQSDIFIELDSLLSDLKNQMGNQVDLSLQMIAEYWNATPSERIGYLHDRIDELENSATVDEDLDIFAP